MGNKRKAPKPDEETYIEADPNEASEEAKRYDADIPESAVGKKLASADKKVRDKAVLVLSNWLSRQHDLDEDAHLKIWKALYYCFWMSDKPPIQNELAEKISQFIHILPNLKQSALFVRVFYLTMGREWPGIDKLRLNKFYYLVRCVQHEMFVFMAQKNWDTEVLDTLNGILSDGPLANEAKSVDLKLHLADVFLDELAKIDSGLTSSVLPNLLEPYFQLLVNCRERSIVERVVSRIFEAFIGEQWLAASLQQGTEPDPIKNEKLRHVNRMFRHTYLEPIPAQDICQLCLDAEFAASTAKQVARRISSFAVKKQTPEYSRKRLYSLLDQYSELCSALGRPLGDDLGLGSEEDENDAAEDNGVDDRERPPEAEHDVTGKEIVVKTKRSEGKADKKRKGGCAEDNTAAIRSSKKSKRSELAGATKALECDGEIETSTRSKKRNKSKAAHEKGTISKGQEVSETDDMEATRGEIRRMTVEERKMMRQRLSIVAEGVGSKTGRGSATVPPTISPRKHAATAADFFIQEPCLVAVDMSAQETDTQGHVSEDKMHVLGKKARQGKRVTAKKRGDEDKGVKHGGDGKAERLARSEARSSGQRQVALGPVGGKV